MKTTYYTLAVLRDGQWSPEFGDYDFETVRQEMDDQRYGEPAEIVRSKPDQGSIDKAIAALRWNK